MTVQDIRFKFILCLCMIFPPLLLSFSSAIYYFENFDFLTGISPYYSTGESDFSGVYFYPQDGIDNKLQGTAVSFNNNIMVGAQPPNAIPLINSAHIVGKVVKVPANSCVAILAYNTRLYGNKEFAYTNLGRSIPGAFGNATNISTLTPGNLSGQQVAYSTTGPLTSSTSFSSIDSCLIGTRYNTSTYSFSGDYNVIVVVNGDDDDLFLSTEQALVNVDNPVVTYDIPTLSNDDVCVTFYIVSYSLTGAGDSYSGYWFAIPHINGAVDIYTNQYSNLYRDNATYYQLRVWSNIGCSIGTTSAGNIYYGIDNRGGQRYASQTYNLALANNNKSSDYVPYWINSVYTTQKQAVWIKNGYVAITNYDELVAKLQEAGIGQVDLARVIALLEEINTGGETGQATRQLMDILEQYHTALVQQGDSDWATINQQFDTFKYLLDFTGDSIHWIVIANNMLFNYFSGFIILCAFFLVINRILR